MGGQGGARGGSGLADSSGSKKRGQQQDVQAVRSVIPQAKRVTVSQLFCLVLAPATPRIAISSRFRSVSRLSSSFLIACFFIGSSLQGPGLSLAIEGALDRENGLS